MSKDKSHKIRNFLARICVGFLAAFGFAGSSKLLLAETAPIVTENKDELGELFEISEKSVPINWDSLNKSKMGKYFKMYFDEFMKKYPDIDKQVNSEDPSINNILVTRDVYGLLKAYYADLFETEELPFDENNFDMGRFNAEVVVKKIDHYVAESDDGLYLNKDDGTQKQIGVNKKDRGLKAITNEFVRITEGDEDNRNSYFIRLAYNVFSEEERIGLHNRPTSEVIYDATKESRNEAKFYKYYGGKLESEENSRPINTGEKPEKAIEKDDDEGR